MNDSPSTSARSGSDPVCSACRKVYDDIPLTPFPEGWGLPRRHYHTNRRTDWCNIQPGFDRVRAIEGTWGWRTSQRSSKLDATQLDLSIEFLEAVRPEYFETPAGAIVAALELEFDTDHVQALRELLTGTWSPLKDLWYPSVPWLPQGSTVALCVIGYESQLLGVA
jgi:hypothetical protein